MKDAQFHRIRRLPPYVFSEVNAMKAAARAAGDDIIDFGMGNPDGATPQPIVDKLIEAVRNPRTHRYSTSRGIPGLRRAQAAYYRRRFGVALDPESEIVVTLGSKEGLANLAQAITAPGDVILAPNPSYPIHPYGFIIAGAAIRHVPLVPEADLMAELAHAAEHSVPPPTAIVLNFPSNPTGLVVDLDFYREIVSFARRRDILLLSDLAYAEIYFAAPPPSILQVPGAKDVAIEFTSLSKTYSMPGWRIGFAAGNAQLIAALTRIKSYLDYGAFTPIQVAATAALNQCDEFVAENRTRYRERRDVLVEGLRTIGWPVPARPRPCSYGRRSPSHIARSARSSSASCCCARPRSRSRQASALASTARASCALPWSRTASASARPCATSGRFSAGARRSRRAPWPEPMAEPLRLGIAGLGTVGSAVLRLLAQNGSLLAERAGRALEVTAVSARHRARSRGVDLGRFRWYDDPIALAADPEVDVVVELIGGADGPALALFQAALGAGKPVVTANKALLAHHGAELARLAEANGVTIGFEAAIAGGIPIVKTLREALAGNRISRVYGILNGTCNYILTTMRESGRGFDDVLAEAQQLGYAEADPSFDIDGVDAAHKLALLAALAFGCAPDFDAVYIEGIRHVSPLDIAFASEMGYRIKLLGVARRTEHGLEQRVHPSMVRIGTPISQVEGVFNAVVAEGDQVDATLYSGRGAGGAPTASAVVADIADIAKGANLPMLGVPSAALQALPPAPMESHYGAYYFRLMVVDQPGVLADVAACLRDHEVSIEALIQRARNPLEPVPIVLTTHETREAQMTGALARIAALPTVLEPPRLIRIEAL